MSSVTKGALNKMTIKQAFDEVNATDEQKKNGLDRLLQSDKKRSFIPQIKRYVAAAAAVVVAAGTAGVGIHFAVINNQGGPINVSIGDNSAADSVITPSENTKVHSEKSGMTFVDDKAFWAQLGRITYFPVDITTAVNTEIYAADDFDSIFCTDKQVQSEILDLFDSAIDITNKYIIFSNINEAVGISSDMSAQEIEKFKNNSANYFTGRTSYNDARFYYADKAYFGFDTTEEFINAVSQVYTGGNSDKFEEYFFEYCPDYIQPADKNNTKSKFGINIDKEFPIPELYSAHTQYCTAFYTDESHNSLILLSLTAKDGANNSKTFELEYISMKYVDGKLRIVVSPYDYIFLNSVCYNNYMFNFGIENKAGTDAKTIDITSVAGDSDNLSQPEETKAGTTISATSTAPQTTVPQTTVPQTTSITTTATTTTTVTTTTTATSKAPTTSATVKPAPAPSDTAKNVTLRMKGSAAYLDKGMLLYYKVDKAFLTNNEVIKIEELKISEVPYINTNGSDYTFKSLDYGTYVIGGPMMKPTGDNGFTVFTVTEKSSNSVINVDLTNGTLSAGKFEVVGETSDFTLSDLADMYYESMEVNGKKYELCDTDITDGWFTGAVIKDYGKGEDGCVRKIYANGNGNTLHFRINNKDYYNISDVIYREVSFSNGDKTIKCTKPYVGYDEFKKVTGEYAEDSVITVTQPVTRDNYDNFGYISIDPHKESCFITDNNNKPLKNKTLSLTYLDELDIADIKSGKAASKTNKYDRMFDIISTTGNGAVYTSMIQKETGTTNIYYGYVGAYVWNDDTDVDPNDDNNTILLYQVSSDGFKYIGTCKYGLIK